MAAHKLISRSETEMINKTITSEKKDITMMKKSQHEISVGANCPEIPVIVRVNTCPDLAYPRWKGLFMHVKGSLLLP